MIKDERNYHQRLQEFCDCFMETDPKKELEKASKGISGDPDDEDGDVVKKIKYLFNVSFISLFSTRSPRQHNECQQACG